MLEIYNEVTGYLIVDLKHAQLDLKLNSSCSLLGFNLLEKLLGKHRHDSFVDAIAEDRPALPAASLTVRKQGGVVPFPGILQDPFSQVVEHLFLVAELASIGMTLVRHLVAVPAVLAPVIAPVAVVKGKRFRLIGILWVGDFCACS